MAKIVIIGAGLTGLSTAYHLEKKGFFEYALFEKESESGGLCRSVYQDGYTFDYTGHLLHVSDPYFKQFIDETAGMHNLTMIIRRSFIYSEGVYTKYPYQINLYGLSEDTIAECIEGFVLRKKKKTVRTFPEWVLANFGAGIAKHFFFPFQKKIFDCDLDDITPSWTGRFVPDTSLKQIIRGSTKNTDDVGVGYNSKFFYPSRGGIMSWITSIANRLQQPIHHNHEVAHIDVAKKIVHFTNGHAEPYEQLITTMPLDILLRVMKESSSMRVKQAESKLRCNSVINFNIGVRHQSLSDKHWIYYPESQFPFYRIGFPHNFSPQSVPAGHHSLYGELSHLNRSSRTIEQRLTTAVQEAKRLLNINNNDITTEKIIRINHAYVIYDLWREKNLAPLLNRLKEHHIYSIGRYGAWKYASMQEAVLDGKTIADTLLIIPAQQAYHLPHLNHQTTRTEPWTQQ